MSSKIFFLIFLSLFLFGCSKICTDKLCFDDVCFELEIPRTNDEFMLGLMFREFLPENQGMLFVFENDAKHGFWMKNTLIPLDLIWLNKELEVVHITTALPCESDPCPTYYPDFDARFVLEINAGLVEKHKISLGSVAVVSLCD